MMSGIKPLSGKIAFLALAGILAYVGTSVYSGSQPSMIKSILLIVAAVILAAEIGLKRFTHLGNSNDVMAAISGVLIFSLFALGMALFVPSIVPQFLINASDFIIFIAAAWIAIEAFV